MYSPVENDHKLVVKGSLDFDSKKHTLFCNLKIELI